MAGGVLDRWSVLTSERGIGCDDCQEEDGLEAEEQSFDCLFHRTGEICRLTSIHTTRNDFANEG